MKNMFAKSALRSNVTKLSLVVALAITAVSCTDDDMAIKPVENKKQDIISVLDNYSSYAADPSAASDMKMGMKAPTFRTLISALQSTGLLTTVVKSDLTLFAPSDEAFAALGLDHKNIGSLPGLAAILTYHAVGAEVYSYMLSNGFVPTLNGAAVEIKLNGGVMVNDARVIRADLPALNGVIHVIDKVLLPPTKNLVELAQSYNPGQFNILVAAVIKAGLTSTLATGGPFTVFAPVDAAFAALLVELGFTDLDAIPVPVLTNVLLYHVVSGRVYSSDLVSGPVTTLNGTFNVNVSTLKITDANGRDANLIPSLLNVQATNGVVHVIDRVILPTL
jgi:transforming growth factor-beta-induced protein